MKNSEIQKTMDFKIEQDSAKARKFKYITWRWRRVKAQNKPLFTAVIIAFVVFWAEILAMLVMTYMENTSPFVHAILDSTILILLITPALYRFVFRPLMIQSHEIKRAQVNLKIKNEKLAGEVAKRTIELKYANRELKIELNDRVLTEELLEKSSSLLRETIESTADGILVIDNNNKVRTYNRKFMNMFNIPQSLLGAANGEKILDTISRQMKSTDTDYEENQIFHENTAEDFSLLEFKDGRIFELYSTPRNLNGKNAGIVLSCRDITDRKNLEQQLFQSQKLEAIGKLAGGIAHDFNNLLTVIIGFGEQALLNMGEGNRASEDVEEIIKAGDRAAGLIRQLFLFSRRQILEPSMLDLNKVISEMEKMLTRVIGENIEMTTELSQDLKRINADIGKIEQVIMNLVVNARDAMPDGGKLSIKTSNVRLNEDFASSELSAESKLYVILTVSDSGIGMDKKTQDRIFEPFFSTKEVGKGTGLGLSTVYGIVKQSEGDLRVYSEQEKGTTIEIYLPAIEDIIEQDQPDNGDKSMPLGTGNIMIVEDEASVRKLARLELAQCGYNIIEACNGNEALEIFNKSDNSVDILITDVIMPGMNGYELADQLKKINPGIKVLFVSGYDTDSILKRGLLEQNTPLVEKPFRTGTLARKVKELMSFDAITL